MKVSLIMISPRKGGLQQSLVSYANALLQAGHELQITASASSPLLDEMDTSNIRLDHVKHDILSRFHLSSIVQIYRSMRSFAPDLAIGFAQYGYPQARIALHGSVPLLSCCGSLNPRTVSMFRSASGFLATTIDMERLAHVMGVPNIYRLPYCLSDRPIRRSSGASGRLRIGAIGRFGRRKGFDVLVEAAALLKQQGLEFDLTIAGDGADAELLQSLATRLGVKVDFPGWLDKEDKTAFYDSLDVFVCPSRHEPFGIILLEALQAGVAVVCTNTSGAREVFTSGEDGLVIDSENVADMANAIKRVLQDTAFRQNIATKGRETFDAKYSSQSVGARMSLILEDVLARHRSFG